MNPDADPGPYRYSKLDRLYYVHNVTKRGADMMPITPDQPNLDGSTEALGGERLISRAELRSFVSVSDMSLHRWLQAKKFVRPIYIGSRRYWKVSEIEAWLKTQSEARQFQDQGGE